MSDDNRITIGWRLRILMAENRITTATELKRRLDAVGYDITSAQLSRIIDDRPAQVKTALLEALMNVLGGTLSDLMPVEGATAKPLAAGDAPVSETNAKRIRKPPRSAEPETNPDDAGGPKVHPFPIPKKPRGEER